MADNSLTAMILWEKMLNAAGMVRAGEKLSPENELTWHLGSSVASYIDGEGLGSTRLLVAGLAAIAHDLYVTFYPAHQCEDALDEWLSRFVLHLCSISQGVHNMTAPAQVLAAAQACGHVDTVPDISDTPNLRVFHYSHKVCREDSAGVSYAADFDAKNCESDDGFWVVYGYDFSGNGHPVAEVTGGEFIGGKEMAALIAECLEQRVPVSDLTRPSTAH